MIRLSLIRWLASCALLSLGAMAWGADPAVVEVGISGRYEVDQQFLHALNRMLDERFVVRPAGDSASGPKPLVRVTLGESAFAEAQSTETPVLGLFVTESAYFRIAQGSHQNTALFYNPPLLRQARLARLVLPKSSRIAILESTTDTRLAYWKPLLEEEGADVQVFLVDSPTELVGVLGRALAWGDYVLGTSDPSLFNGNTLKHLLLTAYRRGKTLIGPGQAYVNAGALASTYSTLDQFALQSSDIIQSYLNSGRLPPPGYPTYFNVEFNSQVARSLNIPLPDISQVESTLRRQESGEKP